MERKFAHLTRGDLLNGGRRETRRPKEQEYIVIYTCLTEVSRSHSIPQSREKGRTLNVRGVSPEMG
jgi:hypothetical protein